MRAPWLAIVVVQIVKSRYPSVIECRVETEGCWTSSEALSTEHRLDGRMLDYPDGP